MIATVPQTVQLLRALADDIENEPDDAQGKAVMVLQVLIEGPAAEELGPSDLAYLRRLGAPRDLLAGATTDRDER